MKKKQICDHRVEIRLTKIQYQTLQLLGGPAATVKQFLDEKAGNKTKLMMLREARQCEIQEIDAMIKEYEELEREEEAKTKEEKTTVPKKKQEKKPQNSIIICPKCNGENILMNKNSAERKCSHCGLMIKKANFKTKNC